MSLKQLLTDELNKFTTGTAGATPVRAAEGPLTLVVNVESIESVGCELNEIRIESNRLANASMERLHQISAALTEKISYLMEPLAEIECDDDRCTLQLRSNPPQKEGDRRAYYELLVQRGGSVTLTRYEKAAGTPREPVPAELTREVLLRLVGDMEAALA